MLSDLVLHDDDRRLPPEALDVLEPVLGVEVLAAFAAVQDQQVETAVGEEELMRGMHDLLAAKVPDVETVGRPARLERPVRDVDALSFRFIAAEGLVQEASDERGFADFAAADENQFGLVEGTRGGEPFPGVRF
jgi:hypothetical protein